MTYADLHKNELYKLVNDANKKYCQTTKNELKVIENGKGGYKVALVAKRNGWGMAKMGSLGKNKYVPIDMDDDYRISGDAARNFANYLDSGDVRDMVHQFERKRRK